MINIFCSILMRWYFFTCIVVIHYFVIDTYTWICISLFYKEMSLFNELSVWTLIRGRFEFPITLSLFDVFKLFVSLLLMCELTLIHLLLLDLYETFLPCFLLYDVKTMAIYLNFVKYYLSTIRIKPEIWEDVQCHEHRASIDCVINMTIDSIVFIK